MSEIFTTREAAREETLRIVHVIVGLEVGGAERMLLKLVESSDPARFEHTVVALLGDGPIGESLRRIGTRVTALGMRRHSVSPRGLYRLSKVLRDEQPDVVQTWLYQADLMGLVAAKLAGARRVVWNVRTTRVHSRFARWTLPVLAKLSRLPDAVIVNSEAGRREHVRLGYTPRRWEVVPNGFELGTFRPDPDARASVRQELGIPGDAPIVIHVARFHERKGQGPFLRAVALARARMPFHVVMAGRGVTRENEELRALMGSEFAPHELHLLGERADVPRLLGASDVFVSSSLVEGFPNALGEAMACGVVAVATDVGDSAVMLGDDRFVVAPGDPTALADAVARALALPRAERDVLGSAARQRVLETYSLDAICSRYAGIYEDLAANRAD